MIHRTVYILESASFAPGHEMIRYAVHRATGQSEAATILELGECVATLVLTPRDKITTEDLLALTRYYSTAHAPIWEKM